MCKLWILLIYYWWLFDVHDVELPCKYVVPGEFFIYIFSFIVFSFLMSGLTTCIAGGKGMPIQYRIVRFWTNKKQFWNISDISTIKKGKKILWSDFSNKLQYSDPSQIRIEIYLKFFSQFARSIYYGKIQFVPGKWVLVFEETLYEQSLLMTM